MIPVVVMALLLLGIVVQIVDEFRPQAFRLRTWCGTEGGYERIIFQTGGHLRFYLTVKAFGFRVRLFGRKPFYAFLRS